NRWELIRRWAHFPAGKDRPASPSPFSARIHPPFCDSDLSPVSALEAAVHCGKLNQRRRYGARPYSLLPEQQRQQRDRRRASMTSVPPQSHPEEAGQTRADGQTERTPRIQAAHGAANIVAKASLPARLASISLLMFAP